MQDEDLQLFDNHIVARTPPAAKIRQLVQDIHRVASLNSSNLRIFVDSRNASGPFSMTLAEPDPRVPDHVWLGTNRFPGSQELIYMPLSSQDPLILFGWIYAHEVRHVLVRNQNLNIKGLKAEYEALRLADSMREVERQLYCIEEFDAEIFAKRICEHLFDSREIIDFMEGGGCGQQTPEYFQCLCRREKTFAGKLPGGWRGSGGTIFV